MSEQKKFLERWSRRKLETGQAAVAPDQSRPHPEEGASAPVSKDGAASRFETRPAGAPQHEAERGPEFDLKSLPSIESIGAASDVRAFLQRGVPPALTRAALRRAWASDPAIRDFIGLSENSWDFNATDSMRGFGPLSPEEVRRAAAQFFAGQEETASRQSADVDAADRNSLVQTASVARESENAAAHEMRKANLDAPDAAGLGQVQKVKNSDNKADVMTPGKQPERDVAAQYKEKDGQYDTETLRRRHGGALPE